jgi:hypothetical protein
VATPIPEEACLFCGFVGCWPIEPSASKKTERTAKNRLALKNSFGGRRFPWFWFGKVTPESYIDSRPGVMFSAFSKTRS